MNPPVSQNPDSGTSDAGQSGRRRPVRRRYRRRRRRTPAPIRWLRDGPAGELLELVAMPLRDHPLPIAITAATLVWWFWPWLRPPANPLSSEADRLPHVVAVSIEDPQRTRTALHIWKARPQALLALMDAGGGALSYDLLRSAELTQAQRLRVVVIDTCGDTVTEMADLSNWLGTLSRPGQLMLVSSPAHIDRMAAIGKVMLGGSGWWVEGVESLSSDHRPESPLRRVRDQLRGQIWRATGWTGKTSLVCPGRARGLF